MRKCLVAALALSCLPMSSAPAATARLDSWSDNDSTFYEYFSDGFFRMDLYSPNQPKNQSFHSISDPSVIYNQNFDGFPNDQFMRFGEVEYDETMLVDGSGTVPISGLTLGIGSDPFDPEFLNYNRFPPETIVDSFTGTIDIVAGRAVGMNLDAEITLVLSNVLSAPEVGHYSATFRVTDTTFEVTGRDTQHFTTVFGAADMEFEWDFQGQTLLTADFDGDLTIDGRDFLTWQRGVGTGGELAEGDANRDGVVDGNDLLFWTARYGSASGGELNAVVVPEPVSVTLIVGLAGGWLLVRRRRVG